MVALQAKFQLTKAPAQPQSCAACGVSAKGYNEFVDFNLSLDFYGAVIFCTDCAKEIAATVGFVDPDTIETFEDVLDDARAANERQAAELELLKNVVFTFGIDVPKPSIVNLSGPSLFDDEEGQPSDEGRQESGNPFSSVKD